MKTIPIPIYGGRLIVARNQPEFDRTYERLLAGEGLQRSDEHEALCKQGVTSSLVLDGELAIICGVFDRRGSTRAHEATHCAQAVAEVKGLDPIREQEAFAYLVQWFYEELAP